MQIILLGLGSIISRETQSPGSVCSNPGRLCLKTIGRHSPTFQNSICHTEHLAISKRRRQIKLSTVPMATCDGPPLLGPRVV